MSSASAEQLLSQNTVPSDAPQAGRGGVRPCNGALSASKSGTEFESSSEAGDFDSLASPNIRRTPFLRRWSTWWYLYQFFEGASLVLGLSTFLCFGALSSFGPAVLILLGSIIAGLLLGFVEWSALQQARRTYDEQGQVLSGLRFKLKNRSSYKSVLEEELSKHSDIGQCDISLEEVQRLEHVGAHADDISKSNDPWLRTSLAIKGFLGGVSVATGIFWPVAFVFNIPLNTASLSLMFTGSVIFGCLGVLMHSYIHVRMIRKFEERPKQVKALREQLEVVNIYIDAYIQLLAPQINDARACSSRNLPCDMKKSVKMSFNSQNQKLVLEPEHQSRAAHDIAQPRDSFVKCRAVDAGNNAQQSTTVPQQAAHR